MFVRTILTVVVMAALILSGFLLMSWSERANAFTGETWADHATQTVPPPSPSGTPTATPVDSAYMPVVIDIVSTPTVWLSPTAPPPPGTDTPTPPPGSTATFTPTATASVPPNATPTPFITPTFPSP